MRATASFFPQLDVGRRREPRSDTIRPPGALPSNTFNLFTLSGTVSYAVDMWGGAAASGRGARRRRRRRSDTRSPAAYIMLSSNVVDAGDRAGRLPRRDRGDDGRRSRSCVNRCGSRTRKRPAGRCPTRTSSRCESQVASTEATLPSLEQKIDQADRSSGRARRGDAGERRAALLSLADLQLPEDFPSVSRRSSSGSVRTFSSPRPSCTPPTRTSAWRQRRCSRT